MKGTLIKFLFTYLFIAVCTLLLPIYAADIDPIIISAGVDRAKVTTGDIIRFEITLSTQKDISIDLPEFGVKIEGFRITDFGKEGPKSDDDKDDRLISKRWYLLQADITGSYILPAVDVTYQDQKYSTSEIFIEVESVLGKEGEKGQEDIRQIKDIIIMPRSLSLWAILMIAIMLFLVAGFIAYRIYQSRNKVVKAIVLPPHQVAIDELKLLQQSTYLQDGEHKRFHFQLSELIRRYFEDSFNLLTSDMTLEEIKSNISKVGNLSKEDESLFIKILERTDLVKFTDTVLPADESQQLLVSGRNFVDSTTEDELLEANDESEDMQEDDEEEMVI